MRVIPTFEYLKDRFVITPTIAWSRWRMGSAGEEETISHSLYFAWGFWVFEIEIEL